MYLGKLRDIAGNELKSAVTDIVIAVPGWFTDAQRRAMLDAAQVAGLNVLRLINDSTAVALGYGITKSDLPEAENPRNVVFVDVGHSNLTVTIIAFSKGQFIVKSTAYNHNLGGRDIDRALVEHFSAQFKEKYKIDILSNPKATFRLAAGCEKLKKVLSANAEATLNVESVMNDIDVHSKLTREEFEGLIAHVLEGVSKPINDAVAQSGLSPDEIDSIELVGGSTRIPAVRQRILAAFPGKHLSFTLNQDEAVARGATFACAMLSPVFKVREFSMHDVTPYTIKVRWERSPEDEDTELVVFPRGNAIPSTKILTFYRRGSFDLEAVYAEPETLPGSINPWIAKFTAKQAGPVDSKGENAPVKVKIKLNTHGVVSFEQLYYEEVEEKEEAPMEVDGNAEPAAPKKKRIIRKKELPFVTGNTGLDQTVLNSLRELEAQMNASDKLVMDTEVSTSCILSFVILTKVKDRKNAVEEYIYDMRGKIEDKYSPYAQPSEKSAVLAVLQQAEDWLYSDEGEDATKSAYVERLDGMKKLGEPIAARFREAEGRAAAASQLRETINTYLSQATSGDEKYSHIDDADKQSVVEKCATVQKWLGDQLAKQAERPKNVNPVVTCAEILKKRDDVIYFVTPILSKPKPKPKVDPAAGTETPKSRTDTPDPTAEQKAQNNKAPTEMDID